MTSPDGRRGLGRLPWLLHLQLWLVGPSALGMRMPLLDVVEWGGSVWICLLGLRASNTTRLRLRADLLSPEMRRLRWLGAVANGLWLLVMASLLRRLAMASLLRRLAMLLRLRVLRPNLLGTGVLRRLLLLTTVLPVRWSLLGL